MDGNAFAEATATLMPTLFRISMSILHHEADAQDALQQALERAWMRRGTVRPLSFRPWLTKILINECRNIQRHRKRVLVTDAFAEPVVEAYDMSLRDALDGLPEKLRTPFLLKYMENFSEKEVAAMLCVPQSTVRGRLYRARQALESQWNEKEAERDAKNTF